MPFRFRLERVMNVRRLVVEQRTRDTAAADRDLRDRIAVEAEIAARYEAFLAKATTAAGEPVHVIDLVEREVYLARLLIEMEEAARDVRLARAELARQQSRLTDAWRDLDVLRKLEATKREQWEEQQRRLEIRQLDEIGGLRADRLRRSKVSSSVA